MNCFPYPSMGILGEVYQGIRGCGTSVCTGEDNLPFTGNRQGINVLLKSVCAGKRISPARSRHWPRFF